MYTCAGTEKAFHFHSFLIDMFFSLSFCITWLKKKNSFNRQETDSTYTYRRNSCTNLCHSHLKVLLGHMNPPFPKSIHPCLCAHTLRNTPAIPSECLCVWKNVQVEYAADSHLNLSTRSSRHQLSYLPQINATSQVHLPGVDLQNVQTGLFMQKEIRWD